MEKEVIANLNNLEITDEDIKALEEAQGWVEEQRKLCLKKFFNLNDYNQKILQRFPFHYTIFWALARDCIVDMNDENINVLWRVKKVKESLPRLMYIKTTKEGTIWTIRFPLGQGKNSKRLIYDTRKIFIPNEEMENFEKEFESEINYLYEKTYTNQC